MKSPLRGLAVATLLTLGLPGIQTPAAIVILNDGKRIEGEVADRGAKWEVKTRYGTLTIRKDDVWEMVSDIDQLMKQADAHRCAARDLYDAASRMDDVSGRDRTLTGALDRLGQALRVLEETRSLFPLADHEELDRVTIDVRRAMRLCRESMGSEETEPSPEPVKTDVTLPPPTPPTPTQAEQWLADARKALADRRHRDARYIADRIVSRYPGTPAAMAARELLDSLPHPDGRLVCGFDNPDDLKAWRRHRPYRSSMRFAAVSDPARIRDGAGAAHLLLPRDPDYTTGAVVFELGRFDEESFRGLSFWIHQERPSPGRLEIAFIRPDQKRLPFIDRWGGSEMGACIYRAIPLDFVGWKQIRIPLSAFRTRGATGSRGKIGWRDVGALVLYDASRKGVDVVIDGLRFLEADRG